MDMNAILAAVGKMFPSVDLTGAMQQAQQAIQGTPDTLEGASAALKRFGVDQTTINNVYQRYCNTMQARALCGMLGTTPEALKNDADRLVGGGAFPPAAMPPRASSPAATSPKFPRLK